MARRVGSPGAVRAIGRVNGQNQIAIVVPCHRVIRADGSLCGYGGGTLAQAVAARSRAPRLKRDCGQTV